MMGIIAEVMGRSDSPASLSEYEAKVLLAEYGIPVTREILATNPGQALQAAETIGYPVVLKGCHPDLAHKSEANVIRLDLRREEEVAEAYRDIESAARLDLQGILVQEMVRGDRQLTVGLLRDRQFGPCVMFGLGGIHTEILSDAAFRIAPLSRRDAESLLDEIHGTRILGAARGAAPADREALADILIGLGTIGLEHELVTDVDVNPLILKADGRPIAVDAAVWLRRN